MTTSSNTTTQGLVDQTKALVSDAKTKLGETVADAKEKIGEVKSDVKDKMDDVKGALGYDTYPQSKVQHRKEFLNDIAKGNWKLNHVTKPSETTLPVFSSDFVDQAKGFLSRKWENVRDTLGYADYPQAKIQHKQKYLNDIANGNWKLKHITTTESYLPVVDFSMDQAKDYFTAKWCDMREALGMDNYPQSTIQHKRAFLNDIAKGNWKLNHVTKPNEASSFLPISQEFVTQARDFFATKWENVRDTLGYPDYPQAEVQHSRAYLNDIAKGNFKLKHVTTTTESYLPVINFSVDQARDYFTTKWVDVKCALGLDLTYNHPQAKINHKQSYLNDIARGNWKLNHVTTTTERYLPVVGFSAQELIEQAKDYLSSKWVDVKAAFGYDDHPQARVQHDQPFLNDIAKGHCSKLHHVSNTSETTHPVVGFPAEYNWDKDVKITKVDRTPFLTEVKDGCCLHHVETTQDRSAPVIEKGVKIEKSDTHQKLLSEVTDFAKDPNHLTHVRTVDKSKPLIDEHMKLHKMEQKHSLLENLKDVFTAATGRTGAS